MLMLMSISTCSHAHPDHHGLRKRLIFIGMDSHTLSLAQKMLVHDWNIICIDWSQQRLETTKYLMIPKEENITGDATPKAVTTTAPVPVTVTSAAATRTTVEPSQSRQPLVDDDPTSEEPSTARSDTSETSTTTPKSVTRQVTSPEGIDETSSFAQYAAEHAVSDEVWNAQREIEGMRF